MNAEVLGRVVNRLLDLQDFKELDVESQLQIINLVDKIIFIYLDEVHVARTPVN